MDIKKFEFNAVPNQANNCYSNLVMYGANGLSDPIVNPNPATVTPQAFWRIKPDRAPRYQEKSSEELWYIRNCKPYASM